jgi:DNA (cytosine-5)-methyltransferase 1
LPVSVRNKKELLVLLDEIYEDAADVGKGHQWQLSGQIREYLDDLTEKSDDAKTGFVNIVTCLACKALDPTVDCRYHRPGIGSDDYFSGRGVSEKVIAPWLSEKDFVSARSGWQTRVYERPRPYKRDYPENISHIKEAFLGILHQVQEKGQDAREALKYLFAEQIRLRDARTIDIARPSIDTIETICDYFERHYSHEYSEKGASRLPVLMVYATYQAMMEEVTRYRDKSLQPLQAHSAADAQTGAIGDIEVQDAQGGKFEGVEIKHGMPIGPQEISEAYEKFKGHSVVRYYLLTTADPYVAEPEESNKLIRDIAARHGCQVIVNGILPTIRYYLRLLERPGKIFGFYRDLLQEDPAIGYEHRIAWNQIVLGQVQP